MHPLVEAVLDEGTTQEIHAKWAPNIVTALGRFGGRTVGVVANNPLRLGGCLDSLSAEKASRFVRMCDAFGVPLIVLVDVPGYLPGVGQEWDGVVRRGAKLLHAFGECVVPRVTLVTRKTYGGAYIAMNARSLGATKVFAWPGAEVAVMGAVAAVRILHRRKLSDVSPEIRPQVEAELAAEHERLAGGVEKAVEIGVVDEIVEPTATRSAIARAIDDAVQTVGVRKGHARQHPPLTGGCPARNRGRTLLVAARRRRSQEGHVAARSRGRGDASRRRALALAWWSACSSSGRAVRRPRRCEAGRRCTPSGARTSATTACSSAAAATTLQLRLTPPEGRLGAGDVHRRPEGQAPGLRRVRRSVRRARRAAPRSGSASPPRGPASSRSGPSSPCQDGDDYVEGWLPVTRSGCAHR